MDLCFGLSTNGLIFFIYFLLFFLGVPLVNETTPSVIVIAPKCYSKATVCHLIQLKLNTCAFWDVLLLLRVKYLMIQTMFRIGTQIKTCHWSWVIIFG